MQLDVQKEIAKINQGEFVNVVYHGAIGKHYVPSVTHVLWAYGFKNYGRFTQGDCFLIHKDDFAAWPTRFNHVIMGSITKTEHKNENDGWEEVTTATLPDTVLTESEPKVVTGDETDEQGNGAEVVSPSSAPPDFSELSYKDIQKELKAIGKSAAGKQDVLLARLNKAYGIS